MKYKITGILSCLCILLLGIFLPSSASTEKVRVHQHEDALKKDGTTYDAAQLSTHLPLVVINTGGVEIPGRAIVSESGSIHGHTVAENGEKTIPGTISVIDQDVSYNHVNDEPEFSSMIEIRVRGNSSRTFDKCNYAINLIYEDGTNNPQKMMGMDAHHEWALHGPFLDKTLLRNYMWYNISGEIMDYAPNVRFCEVIINGEYLGVYVMMETITAGSNGARLNLAVNKKQNTFSGYILRLDRGSEVPIKNIQTFTKYAKRTKQKMDIAYPGTRNLTEEIVDGIVNEFSQFEKALYSFDYDNTDMGYDTFLDTESFIDYFLINEFTCNYDAGWLSTYVYKELDEKYRMCVWDFNSACDNYQLSQTEPMVFQMQNCLWYFMLMKDEDFVEQLIERYWELRETYFNETYLCSYIDGVVEYLGDAVERNYEIWNYTFDEQEDKLRPAERNPRSYEEAVQQMKDFFPKRIAWMDKNIDTLLQYCAESKVKKVNENAN